MKRDPQYRGETTTDASIEEFLRRVDRDERPAEEVMAAHERGEDPILLGLLGSYQPRDAKPLPSVSEAARKREERK